jgi:D-arabinose 5-phosphate isomerase GutQ
MPNGRIYTVAAGRSNLMLLNAGMRLVHAGFNVYEVSEYYTPAIGLDSRFNDIVLFSSGSGNTNVVKRTLRVAKDNNVPAFGICSNKDSETVSLAGTDNVIITKGKRIYPNNQVPKERNQPLNFLQTKSEVKTLWILELIVNAVAKKKGLTEDDFRRRHANTE